MKSNRRKFFQTMGAGAAGLTLGTATMSLSSTASPTVKKEDEDGQKLFIGDNIAVADTQYGKVRGYVLRGINYFLGIPYGADTSGANRFMPPQKPKPWADVYPALWWGNSAPQVRENRYGNKYGAFRDHWNYDDISEDCLKINVFTPGFNDGKKRPVLVWLHGGGYTSGNSIEHDGYNGENLSRFGDIVFCSLNHRLGPLGFTDLSGVGGEKYAASGNVGMLDIIAALEWVRDNISNLGGDPSNVTIIGQSGGGKVCTLTAMPSAKGLFHKAVTLSGATSMVKLGDKENCQKRGVYILKKAGLTASQVDKLQELTWQEYYSLATKANDKLSKETGAVGLQSGFTPVVDGVILPQHPFLNGAAPTADQVPMIITSTFNEQSPSWADSKIENITMEEVIERVKVSSGFSEPGFGDKASKIVEAYNKAFPGKKPVEILSLITSNRRNMITVADAKSKQSAPVYLAWFGWQPPLFDYRLRAFHCVDICFWFHNTDLMLTHTGGGSRPRNLSVKMASALIQFMKTGDPNEGGLPQWPKYTTANGETMILDDVCEVKNDPDRVARKLI